MTRDEVREEVVTVLEASTPQSLVPVVVPVEQRNRARPS